LRESFLEWNKKNIMINIDEINKRECESFDRKQSHHLDKAALLHDILCLANSDTSSDRYIMYGINDDGQKIGIQNDPNRKSSNQFMDWYAKIFFNKRPKIEFFTTESDGLVFDVLRIKNERYKPFFILKDYTDKDYRNKYEKSGKTVRSGSVYTRIGDTNTPINSFADDHSLERMFRERFCIEAASIERIKNYLYDDQHWKCSYDQEDNLFFYYEYFPEFTVSLSRKYLDVFNDPWVKHFPDKKATSYRVFTKYHATVLHETIAVWCDGARFLTIIPHIWSNARNIQDFQGNVYQSFYFISETLEYLINEMIKKTYKYISSEFYLPPFAIFDSSENAHKQLEKNLSEDKAKFVYYYFDSKSKKLKWIKAAKEMGEFLP